MLRNYLLTALRNIRRNASFSVINIAGLALGMVGGIGFTVSLFIAALAFEDQPALLADAKMAVLAGSAIIGVAGLVTLRWLLPENAPAERA